MKICTYRACHKMLMFMQFRQHNSSRSLITPSLCYSTCLDYSGLLITRNICAIMEFYVDHSASHFMRLCRKGTDNSYNVVSNHSKRRTIDARWFDEAKDSQLFMEETSISCHNTRVGFCDWASCTCNPQSVVLQETESCSSQCGNMEQSSITILIII